MTVSYPTPPSPNNHNYTIPYFTLYTPTQSKKNIIKQTVNRPTMKLTAPATLSASQMQFLTIGIQQKNWFALWLQQNFHIDVTIV